jgi:hypothetical protein
MLRRSNRGFELLLVLAVATLLPAHAQQAPIPDRAGRNVHIEMSLTPEGEVCKAMIVACGQSVDPRRVEHPEQLYSIVEHLAPPDERGVRKPETSARRIERCVNWRREDYEHVTILYGQFSIPDSDGCGTTESFTMIDWKARGPNCAPIHVTPSTICARQVGSLEKSYTEVTKYLITLALSMESAAAVEGTNQELKQALQSYARQIRRVISMFTEH